MPETILCITNFNDSSKTAIRWAAALAVRMNARLTVLYVYRLINPDTEEPLAAKQKIEAEASTKFAQLEKELLTPSALDYDFRSEVGFVPNRVEAFAKQHNVTFLVLDKKFNEHNKEVLEELIQRVTIPLVILP